MAWFILAHLQMILRELTDQWVFAIAMTISLAVAAIAFVDAVRDDIKKERVK